MLRISNNPKVREKFDNVLSETVFGFKSLSPHEIERYFTDFKRSVDSVQDNPILKMLISRLPEEALKEIEETFIGDLDEGIDIYCIEKFDSKRIDTHGLCLKSKLIGAACELRNTDELGVVREICDDEKHLIVDFGHGEGNTKVDIYELIIAGQIK